MTETENQELETQEEAQQETTETGELSSEGADVAIEPSEPADSATADEPGEDEDGDGSN